MMHLLWELYFRLFPEIRFLGFVCPAKYSRKVNVGEIYFVFALFSIVSIYAYYGWREFRNMLTSHRQVQESVSWLFNSGTSAQNVYATNLKNIQETMSILSTSVRNANKELYMSLMEHGNIKLNKPPEWKTTKQTNPPDSSVEKKDSLLYLKVPQEIKAGAVMYVGERLENVVYRYRYYENILALTRILRLNNMGAGYPLDALDYRDDKNEGTAPIADDSNVSFDHFRENFVCEEATSTPSISTQSFEVVDDQNNDFLSEETTSVT